MNDNQALLEQIKDLYNQIDFNLIAIGSEQEQDPQGYVRNKELSHEIIGLIQQVLQNDAYNKEALFWKIKIYDGPVLFDTSIMLETADFIIENLKEDLEAVLQAYHYQAWIYEYKLHLPQKAIQSLEDRLIVLSLAKENYSLVDHKFAETYYMLALLYKDMDKVDSSMDYYSLCLEHYPDHNLALFEAGLLYLEQRNYPKAYDYLERFCTYFSEDRNVEIGRELEKHFHKGDLDLSVDLIGLLYRIEIRNYKDFRAVTSKQISNRFSKWLKMDAKTSSEAVLRMQIEHFISCEKNYPKLWNLLEIYFQNHPVIQNEYYFYYFETCLALEITPKHFSFQLDGFSGCMLALAFIERAEYFLNNDQRDLALSYFKETLKISQYTLEVIHTYFEFGTGSKVSNNKKGYSWVCNAFGTCVYNIALLEEQTNKEDPIFNKAVEMHKKGFELEPLRENLHNGFLLSSFIGDMVSCEWFLRELLDYYPFFTLEWLRVQSSIVNCYIEMDNQEKVLSHFELLTKDFLNQEIQDQDLVEQMIYIAAEVFSYIRYQKHQYELCITLTNNFFEHATFLENAPIVGKVNYWFSLGWSYHGLKKEVLALQYFTLIRENFSDNPHYASTIEDIPKEYVVGVTERQAMHRLKDWMDHKEVHQQKEYSLFDQRIDHSLYLEHSLELVLRDWKQPLSMWIDDQMHISVSPKHLASEQTNSGYQTYISVYLNDQQITIQFLIEEISYNKKSFFGLLNSPGWHKSFNVWIYHHKNNEIQASHFTSFKDSNTQIQQTVQKIWNTWLTKSII
ncbi:tetratricopeptide repeat protein [Myroides sp. LJL116]